MYMLAIELYLVVGRFGIMEYVSGRSWKGHNWPCIQNVMKSKGGKVALKTRIDCNAENATLISC